MTTCRIGTLQCEPNPCNNNGTCIYIGGEEEFTCQCTDGFVGEHCEIECKSFLIRTLLYDNLVKLASPLQNCVFVWSGSLI